MRSVPLITQSWWARVSLFVCNLAQCLFMCGSDSSQTAAGIVFQFSGARGFPHPAKDAFDAPTSSSITKQHLNSGEYIFIYQPTDRNHWQPTIPATPSRIVPIAFWFVATGDIHLNLYGFIPLPLSVVKHSVICLYTVSIYKQNSHCFILFVFLPHQTATDWLSFAYRQWAWLSRYSN